MYTRIIVQYTSRGVLWTDITTWKESSEEILTALGPSIEIEELYGGAVQARLSEINSLNLALVIARAQIMARDYRFGRE